LTLFTFQKKNIKACTIYKTYSPEALLKAYNLVKERRIPVKKAARMYNVPQQTLRDRVLGKTDPIHSGHETLFTHEEEKVLVNHLKTRAELGYGLTNVYTQKLAGEMALDLGWRNNH